MRRLATIILALLAFSLIIPTNTVLADEQTVTVVADGYSYLGDNDTIKIARERALAEAERNAVEQGSYSYLESQTTVKNSQVTTDEIKSQAKGVITNKKILVKTRGKPGLMIRIRSIKKHKPQEYIYIMEMLFPEVRPRSLERYWLKKRAGERRGLAASNPKAPVRR